MYVFSLAINVAICLSNDVCIYSHYLMHVCKETCIRTHVTCVFFHMFMAQYYKHMDLHAYSKLHVYFVVNACMVQACHV